MFSSSSQWLSFKLALGCGSSLMMAIYSLILVNLINQDHLINNDRLTSLKLQQEKSCQFAVANFSNHYPKLGLNINPHTIINASTLPNNSLNLQNCLQAIVFPNNSNTKQQLIISPTTFPDLWKAAENTNQAISKPFPYIHESARAAKVPIFMYHDILPKKEVFFDVTPEELESHFKYIQEQGLTPISLDLLLDHLQKGIPLPNKPILLSFDDGYGGHYDHVYPLLKKYNYPAVFSVYVKKMEGKTARSSLTWNQLQQLANDPLITIAAHTISHPRDLRKLSDDELFQEVIMSKEILEERLGIPIKYFTYPEGKHDARVKHWAMAAGYQMALSMSNEEEIFVGESPDLLSIGRFGQSQLRVVSPEAWGGYPGEHLNEGFDFTANITKREHHIDGVELIIINGGKPSTIHADSRYQVPEIITNTQAVAAVDGGFFSLKYLDSNVMIGPVMSEGGEFTPGNKSENPRLNGRPLVLISDKWVKFVPFDAEIHNSWLGVTAESDDGEFITDTFVAAAWLVKDSLAQPYESFGNLFDFHVPRHRAFWGIHRSGQPMIGVSKNPVDSIKLGEILQQLGFREAVMLDSGASTSLAYQGESLVGYIPRPVPHVVVLLPSISYLLATEE